MASPLSYEYLYDLLRREKTQPEIQKLESAFLADLREYLTARINHIKEQSSKPSVFSTQESIATEKQLENIKRIIRELYERRETKILTLALSSSRTSAKYDTNVLLEEERKLFVSVKELLDKSRAATFESLSKEEEPKEINAGLGRQVKFLNPTPQFLGTDLKQYGPFEQEHITSLPEDIAQLLIKNKRVEEI